MANSKNALIRYRTIDKCLQNRSRRWTLDDLIEACSNALFEYDGKSDQVSKRTVQLDIQFMRSNKLGYNAPISVYQKKYYTYSDEEYSITEVPLTQLDMDILSESVDVLSQFKDFSLFTELNGVVQKLQDKVYREAKRLTPIIHIDKNEKLKGLHHLNTLYQAILKEIVLIISYQSFNASTPNEFAFHGYILKEFNNRWFLIGKKHGSEKILTLALDRIVNINFDLSIPFESGSFNPDTFYQNTYGVTVLNDEQLIVITLKINKSNAPYIMTKPLHHSQKLIKQFEDGSVLIQIKVYHNFEIEGLILGFGESIEVLEPIRLRKRIKSKLERALVQYID